MNPSGGGAGLIHPFDTAAWKRWQQGRQPVYRRLRRSRTRPTPWTLSTGDEPEILVTMQAGSRSWTAAVLAPLGHLHRAEVAVLADGDRRDTIPGPARTAPVHTVRDLVDQLGPAPVVVVPTSIGEPHELAIAAARATGGRLFVVQHGLVTPFAPPLPRDCTLLAWSEADGAFWRAGRSDVHVEVVGSQLLWEAAQAAGEVPVADGPPLFLGQLHAAELTRRDLSAVSFGFCRDHDARYRPHPAEIDLASRVQHALWRRRGIRFDDSGVPLERSPAPVAAIFSTGVLEAAAAGRPGWVHHPRPPGWLSQMWERYGLSRWGDPPSAPPPTPPVEPARKIAALIAQAV